MWCFLTVWSLQNLPFNLARTLLAVFLISAIKSSSSCLTSETNKCRLLTHTLTKLWHVPEFEQQLLKDLHYSFRRHGQNKVTSWLTLLVHIQKILESGDWLSLACPGLQHFTTTHNFQKKTITHKTCVFIFPKTFVWNISHSRKNWVGVWSKMYIALRVKYPLFLSNFLDRFSKTIPISNFMKICPLRAELFHADIRTDRWAEEQTWRS